MHRLGCDRTRRLYAPCGAAAAVTPVRCSHSRRIRQLVCVRVQRPHSHANAEATARAPAAGTPRASAANAPRPNVTRPPRGRPLTPQAAHLLLACRCLAPALQTQVVRHVGQRAAHMHAMQAASIGAEHRRSSSRRRGACSMQHITHRHHAARCMHARVATCVLCTIVARRHASRRESPPAAALYDKQAGDVSRRIGAVLRPDLAATRSYARR